MKEKIESFEDLQVYRLAEDLGDRIWQIVLKWSDFAKNTLGYQLVKAVDSIGANIAEGSGVFILGRTDSLQGFRVVLFMKHAIGFAGLTRGLY